MKLGIIDLGTNTFNLLIVSVKEDGTLLPAERSERIYSGRTVVMLGEGGIEKQRITPEAISRAIKALQQHLETIHEYHCDKVLAFGTSAIRSATNGQELVNKAREELGLTIQVIDGDKEAELIWLGARQALSLGSTPSLLLDVGGGSNEFVLATDEKLLWKLSIEAGVSRMLEAFPHHEPILPEEADRIRDHYRDHLQPLFERCRETPVKVLTGSSGSFEALAAMIAHRFHQDDDLAGMSSYIFRPEEFHHIHALLMRSDLEERKAIPGLSPMRARMIVLGTLLIELVVKELGIETIRCSYYALKEGILAEVLSGTLEPMAVATEPPPKKP